MGSIQQTRLSEGTLERWIAGLQPISTLNEGVNFWPHARIGRGPVFVEASGFVGLVECCRCLRCHALHLLPLYLFQN
jgi:hypothetical protein